MMSILMSFFVFQKIKSFGEEITLGNFGQEVHTIKVLLFGTKNNLKH